MMNKLVLTATVASIASLAACSQHQKYPGAQTRINQNLLDGIRVPLFTEMVDIVSDVEQLVPKEFTFGDLAITNVSFDKPRVDVNSSVITIDNENSGIFIQLPKINRHVIHIDFDYTIYYVIPFTFGIDIKLKDFQPQGAISILADPVTGAPKVTMYNTYIDFGRSDLRFTDNVILKTIWFFVDWLKTPVFWVLNWYMDTIANYIVQEVIVPDVLQNGILRIPVGQNSTLVLDMALPKSPLYNSRLFDLFVDASIYIDEEGQQHASPVQPLTFQETIPSDFQGVVSAFTANSVINTLVNSQMIAITIPYDILEGLIGVTLTTGFFEKIIPQLEQTYGDKNLSIVMQPQKGTEVHWNKENEETQLTLSTFVHFYIVNADLSQTLAFNALTTFNFNVTLEIDTDKTIELNVEEMTLSSFTVLEDNCNTKADEANIQRRLNELMGTVQESINYLLPLLGIKLPTFAGFDYSVSLDY